MREMVPLMSDSGYRAEVLRISDSGAIRRRNRSGATTGIVDFVDDLRVGFWRRLEIGVPF